MIKILYKINVVTVFKSFNSLRIPSEFELFGDIQNCIKMFFLIYIFVYNSNLNAQASCSFQLENPDFENPDILAKYGAAGNAIVNESDVLGWKTTATDNMIEIWRSGFLGVPAYSGNQFVELNANMVSALYNDANTIPGTTITFGFAHRGRQGTDVLELKIGPPGGPYISQGTYATGNAAWNYYTTSYVVPAGQTQTRFYFSAVSSAGGNPGIGNFLDNINVTGVNIDMHLTATSACGDSLGKIEATVSTPPGVVLQYSVDNITFQSSPIFNHLSAGSYKVYLKANGICMNSQSIVVKTKPAVLVNLGNDTSVCAGSTVVLDAKNSGASYLWNNAQTSQTIAVNSTNNYFVELTDTNGCKGYDTVFVKVNALPVVELGGDKDICEGFSVQLDAGNSGSTFLWSDGSTAQNIKVNSSNTYFVEVRDANGCRGSDTIAISVNKNPVVNLGADKVFCSDSSVTLDAGNTGLNFLWSTLESTQKITVNASNKYTVEVTDANGCKGTASVNVLSKPCYSCDSWQQSAFDGFEYTGNDPYIVPGSLVTPSATNTACPHNGSKALYLNFGKVGPAYLRPYDVCVNRKYKFDFWAKDCWGDKNDFTINVYDNSGALLTTLSKKTAGTTWVNVETSVFLATTSKIKFELVNNTNVGGNDLSFDDLRLQMCSTPDTITSSNISFCGKASAFNLIDSISTAITSGVWSGPSVLGGGVNGTFDPATMLAGDYIYSDANGCRSIKNKVTIKINTKPLVNLGNDTSFCEGNTLQLDAKNVGSFYSWSTGKNTEKIVVDKSGNYSATVTDTNGCSASDTIAISVNKNPVVNLGVDQQICPTSFATFDAANISANYLWSNGAKTQTIKVNTTNDYSVEVTNANGCIGRDTVHLQVDPNLKVVLGNDKIICEGDSVSIDAGNFGANYLWNNGSTSQSIYAKNSGTYFVEVTDINGCKGSDTLLVNVNTNPLVNLGADKEFCQGSFVTIDAGNAGAHYLWSNGSTTQSIKVNSSSTYFVEVTDVNGCKGRDTVNVNVLSSPLVYLGADKSLCAGDSATLDAGNIGSTYLWKTGETSKKISVKSSSVYFVEVSDAKGCKGYDTISVKVNANPIVNLGPDKEFCEGSSVTLDAGNIGANYLWSTSATSKTISVNNSGSFYVAVIDANGCKGYDTIQTTMNLKSPVNLGSDKTICEGDTAVTFDAGNIGATFLWSNGATTQTISTNKSEVYFVEVTNAKGCISKDTVALVVNAKPMVDLGNNLVLCKGKSLLLDAQNTGSTFTWNTGASTSKILVTQAGNYIVNVLNSKGCSATSTITISNDSVTNPISYSDTLICEGTKILLRADMNNGNSIVWHSNHQNELTVSTYGTYYYTANKGICKDTFAVNVNALEVPKITITDLYGKSSYCFENEKTLLQLSGDNLMKYNIQWQDTLINTENFEISRAGEYSAIVSNGKCSTEVKTFVTEYCAPTLFIPNTFTPNNDGTNDVFKTYQSGNIQDYEMNIFNRWGEIIYSTNNINDGWDGKVNGLNAQIDVYIYKISYSTQNENDIKIKDVKTGIVNLIR